jgi:dienelactone hydrolase
MSIFTRKIFLALTLLIGSTPVFAAIKGETVTYQSDNTVLKGYIAYDTSISGKRPGVIIVPDWWGVGDFARDRAKALASQGYTAMVMDMYGDGLNVDSATEAGELMRQFTSKPAVMKSRFMSTRNTLSKHKTVDTNRIGAIGYSLGGLVVLNMTREGVDLDGVASIWGVIDKPASPAKQDSVKTKVLILNPEKDGWAPAESLEALKNEMQNAGAEFRIITYPDTVHAFSRPDADLKAKKDKLPIRYNAKVDKQSWNDLTAFLETAFQH